MSPDFGINISHLYAYDINIAQISEHDEQRIKGKVNKTMGK